MRTCFSFSLLALLLLFASCSHVQIDLSGSWGFKTDPEDIGAQKTWFTQTLSESIELPGSMASNGLGDNVTMETYWTGGMRNPTWFNDPNYKAFHDPDNIRYPYWLQPVKKYYGAAWYQKKIDIPKSWKSNSIAIHLERVHWESTLWFDDQLIGMKNSLASAHEFVINDIATPGEHTITIRVDNRTKDIDVGWNSHSISDHTQSNWNGIVGEMKITPMSGVRLSEVRITSNIEDYTITVDGVIGETRGERRETRGERRKTRDESREVKVVARVLEFDGVKKVFDLELDPGKNTFSFDLELEEEAGLWDEFDPNLYTLELEVSSGKDHDQVTETFGLRKIEANSQGIFVNGRRTFLRGTLECAIFPLTGYPSTDPAEWKRILQVIKDHGLNHMRFHSWCPPEAAFIAADEMGIYLQVECSSWANQTTTIGDGLPIDQYIWDESRRIINQYGNHPSFVMMAYGNEPGGRNQNAFLTEFVSYWKENDPRRLYTSGAGWPRLAVNDFHNVPQPRIQGWGESLNSIINAHPPSSSYDWSNRIPSTQNPEPFTDKIIPVVSHEIGQWCVYPNFKETEKYTGVLKAKNFEIFAESLAAHHMAHLSDSFLLASGKLQALCYKADIEAALRTPQFGGFQLLDLHDFPGQGTALVGILDPFWEEKGYISAKEFSQFCNTVVPLARLEKHVFAEGEKIEVPIQVSYFDMTPDKTQEPRPKTQIRLKTKESRVLSSEEFEVEFEPGKLNDVGVFTHRFEEIGEPQQLKLEVQYGEFINSWNIWVFPKYNDPPESLIVASQLNPKTMETLISGGTVLLSLGQGRVSPHFGGDVGVGFSSIFWNTAWTGGQKPHTLGILCNPDHPALAEFPTDYYSDWQWWDALAHADAIKLDGWADGHSPLVRIIDDWVSNRQLALIVEAKVGKGKIIISGADLHTDLSTRPAAAQLRSSLEKYMQSENFEPTIELSEAQLQKMIRE